jgi:chromosome segregation ATPase
MGVNILEMLRGRREARASNIEELAIRLAKGETVPPEEVETWLEQTGTDEAMLQERVDALERRADLLAKVSAGHKAQARLDKIEAELADAEAAVTKAREAYLSLRAKHDEPMILLGAQVREGDRANDLLIAPENLSHVDRERLAAARKAAADAGERLSEVRRSLPELRLNLEQAERHHADVVDLAKAHRGNADIQERKARAENAVKTRREKVAAAADELPRLQAAFDEAEAAVSRLEDELRR